MTERRREVIERLVMIYKLICWDDFSIPVPVSMKWLCFDHSGAYVFEDIPTYFGKYRGWLANLNAQLPTEFLVEGVHIDPPKPGPFESQIYWIG